MTVSVKVEVGFGQSVGNRRDGMTWTDVTARALTVGDCGFSRGRAVPGSQPTAGDAHVTFDNDDGSLTPGRGGGGGYGPVTTRVPVRIRGDAGAGLRDLWAGFVTDWDWSYNLTTRVSLTAADIIATAAKVKCLPWLSGRMGNPPSLEAGNVDVDGGAAATAAWVDVDGGDAASVDADYLDGWDGGDATAASEVDPVGWWPLDDPGTATVAAAGLPGGVAATVYNDGGDLTFGVESDLGPDADPVVAMTPASPSAGTWLSSQVTAAGGDLAVAAWIRPTADQAMTVVVVSQLSGGPLLLPIHVWINADQVLTVTEFDGGSGVSGGYGAVALGRWTHVYAQRAADVTGSFADRFRVWVDGVERDLSSGGASVTAAPAWGTTYTVGVGSFYLTPWSGQLAQVAVFDYLGGGTLAAHLADRGTTAPTAAARFQQLPHVTVAPVPLSTWLAADDDADALISAQATAQVTLLALATQIADTERGHLIAARDGRLRLQSSRSRVSATPVLTLSAATDVMATGGGFSIDDADLVSEVAVTNQPSGTVYRATRPSSALNSGVESTTLEVFAADPLQAEAVASALVNLDTDVPRSPQLLVSMDHADAAGLADALLTLELGDLIEVTDLPATAPASTLRLVVEAIAHAGVGRPGWTVTIATSPGEVAVGWVLGDEVLSLLGATTILRL